MIVDRLRCAVMTLQIEILYGNNENGGLTLRLDGYGLFVKRRNAFLLYGRKDFENMTHRKYEYIKGMNGHSEIALYVDTFEEVDTAYNNAIKNGATSVLEPELEPWGQRTCYIADPEGNLIEIGSWNKSYEEKDL